MTSSFDSTLLVLYEQETFTALERSFYANCLRYVHADTCLIGIRTGGDILAERLAEFVVNAGKPKPDVGYLDISLYRDDFGHRNHWPTIQASDIAFDISDRNILLVDEVLFTGRTIRSALEALNDIGRASSIRLATLFDRGQRELPICADVVGTTVEISRDDSLLVEFNGYNGDRAITLRKMEK